MQRHVNARKTIEIDDMRRNFFDFRNFSDRRGVNFQLAGVVAHQPFVGVRRIFVVDDQRLVPPDGKKVDGALYEHFVLAVRCKERVCGQGQQKFLLSVQGKAAQISEQGKGENARHLLSVQFCRKFGARLFKEGEYAFRLPFGRREKVRPF